MIRTCGAALVVTGGILAGYLGRCWYQKRARCIREWLDTLETMERLIGDLGCSTPDVLERLGQETGSLGALFQRCRERIESGRTDGFAALWRDALAREEMPLRREEQEILLQLGDVLGQFDAARQCEALRTAARRMERRLECAEDERQRLGRLWCLLGGASGALMAILLL